MKERSFENDYAEFWLEDEIIYFIYKPGTVLTMAAMAPVAAPCLNLPAPGVRGLSM